MAAYQTSEASIVEWTSEVVQASLEDWTSVVDLDQAWAVDSKIVVQPSAVVQP